jgi:hypothetical protein
LEVDWIGDGDEEQGAGGWVGWSGWGRDPRAGAREKKKIRDRGGMEKVALYCCVEGGEERRARARAQDQSLNQTEPRRAGAKALHQKDGT